MNPMRVFLTSLITLVVTFSINADEPPMVEQYLHSGSYAQGEQELMVVLSLDPEDDQIRFGLGVLQFIHGIERLGQSLYYYGVKSKHTETQHAERWCNPIRTAAHHLRAAIRTVKLEQASRSLRDTSSSTWRWLHRSQ